MFAAAQSFSIVLVLVVVSSGCEQSAGTSPDARTDAATDAVAIDARVDAGPADLLAADLAPTHDTKNPVDQASADTGSADVALVDADTPDVGTPDVGTPDVGTPDMGTPDMGTPDMGTPDMGTPDMGTADAGAVLGCGAGNASLVKGLRTSTGFGPKVDAYGVVAGPGGAVTIVGALSGSETFGVGTAQQTLLKGSQLGSPLVLRFDASGIFQWGKVFSTSSGSASAVGLASDGSLVVTGSFEGTLIADYGLPTQVQLDGPGSKDGYDVFVARLGAQGALTWLKAAGGAPYDFPGALAVAPDGSSTVAGRYGDFSDPNTITFDATHALTSSGRWEELFIARYDPQGVVQWVRQAGSPGRDDYVNGITRLADGSVVLTGALDQGKAVFEGGAAGDQSLSVTGSVGYFLARYSAGGDLLWLRGATGDASGTSVASFGTSIAVAVTGSAGSTFNPGASAKSLVNSARAVARYSGGGDLLSLTPVMNNISIGGIVDLAAASDGTIALTGSYYSQATFFTKSGDLVLKPTGWDDAFVACLPPGGTALSWLRSAKGTLQDYGRAITFDGAGRIVAAGTTRDGMSFETASTTTQPVQPGENGFYVTIDR